MATNIFNFNGTLLTTVADGTIDTTHSSLKFPGKGYQNYGEPVMENLLWTMTNFAGTTQPSIPLTGQGWYDTNTSVLKVYNGTSWQAAGGVLVSAVQPATGTNVGAYWYDSTNLQLYVWNGSAWNLIGPLGSSVNTDPLNPAIPTNSAIDSIRITDNAGNNHQVWRITVSGLLFAIVSKDAAFTPNTAIAGFSSISPGINFNTTVSNVGLSGDATTFKNNQSNIPVSDNTYTLGGVSNRFSTIYGVNLLGTYMGLGSNASVGTYTLQVNGTANLNGAVTVGSGTTTAAPITLTASTGLLTSPKLGAIEFDGNQMYVTVNINSTPTRSVIVAGQSGSNVAAVANTVPIRDSNASITANLFIGTATSAYYADVAERYETDTPVEPGDVVILGGDREITTTTVGYDTSVFGVISTNPAVRMNEAAGDDATHPFVAMLGRVPCKVIGPVKKFQRLVTSSTPGVAMGEITGQTGAAFARSLVNKDSDDIEIVEVVLTGRA